MQEHPSAATRAQGMQRNVLGSSSGCQPGAPSHVTLLALQMIASGLRVHAPLVAWILAAALGHSAATAAQPTARHAPSIDLAAAAQIFREARALSERDGGRLWGVALYGPMLFWDPDSRFMVANQADARGILKPHGGVFTGTVPPGELFANTAQTWSGVLWTQIMWPLPRDPERRDLLIAHECFHRIRARLHLPPLRMANNSQLDTLQGRYLLQLEWRALSHALAGRTAADRKAAAADALLFRARRYQLFPAAAEQENNLEYNEGLAEYTGVKAGCEGHAAQLRCAQRDLTGVAHEPSFVRSFAYATGPAYGLLLDRYLPAWRRQLASGKRLDELLAQALHVSPGGDLAAQVAARSTLYDGAPLLQAETVRDRERQKRLAVYRQMFIEHPVLVLPLKHMQVQFDPRDVLSFEQHGSVYPKLSVTDDWGTLSAQQGALVDPQFHTVTVPAPTSSTAGHLAGNGWTVLLKPGWKLVAGARKGDFTLARPD